MDGYLRQATASQVRTIGPYVDDTDFKTAETGLTVANTDIKILKNGGASASKNSGGGTHDVNGMYAVTWNATDTATLGELKYTSKVAGALQVFGSYQVIEASEYDAMFATTGAVPSRGISARGTAQSASATGLRLATGETFADDTPIGSTLWAFGSTQGYWQHRPITDYVSSTDDATVPTWNVTPSGTITYVVFGTAPATTSGSGLDAAGVRAAVGLASANLDTQLNDLPTNAELATSQGTADDATLAAIAALNNLSSAQLATALSTSLTTTLPDSIPADGTRPTIQQALYMIVQYLTERTVVSTTATIKKVDGSTTLWTQTNNSATNPTSTTRAT